MTLSRLFFLGRLARRNALRHKGQTIRAVLGLVIATVILGGGLVMGDSVRESFGTTTTARFGTIDLLLRSQAPFDAVLADELPATAALPHVQGAATLLLTGTISNPRTGLAQSAAHVRGISAREAATLGPLFALDGGVAPQARTGQTVPEPRAGEVVLSANAAGTLGALVGDTVTLRAQSPSGGAVSLSARVAGIAVPLARSGITGRPVALVPLADLQAATNLPGQANGAFFSTSRAEGATPGADATALRDALPAAVAARTVVLAERDNAVEESIEAGLGVGLGIVAMSAFTLLAASLLAFTLFSALVEERRAEIGIARAMGLTRAEVALALTIEGALYSFAAAVIGVLLGIAFAWTALMVIGDALGSEFGEQVPFALHVTPATVGWSLLAGTIFPLLTIGIASLRFARLDPARAIRGIPDDPKARRRVALIWAGVLVGLGVLLSVVPDGHPAGIPVALLGLALGLAGLKRPLLAVLASALGVLHIAYSSYAHVFTGDEMDVLVTFGRGALLALALSALAVASARPYEALLRLLVRAKGSQRGAFIGVRYLVARRWFAGLTMAMISLVVLMVAVMGMMFNTIGAEMSPDATGGYQVFATVPAPIEGFPAPLPDDVARDVERAVFVPRHDEVRAATWVRAGESVRVADGIRQFIGVTPEFAADNAFALGLRAPAFATDRAAWDAVAAGTALVVPQWVLENARLALGERISLQTAGMAPREFVVAGGYDPDMFGWLVFVATDAVRAMDLPFATEVFVRATKGADDVRLAHRLTDVLAAEGAVVGAVVTSLQEEITAEAGGVTDLANGLVAFLALGLFVGLAGTGFLAGRAVRERMRDIGTLRALGYEEADVQRAFILESMLTAGMGILIGTIAGLLTAHSLWYRMMRNFGAPFEPPWLMLAGMTLAVLIIAAWASSGPARRAARLAPAIAVRHVE